MLIVLPSHAANGYFDHVHIRHIARGVPEHKVSLYAVHIYSMLMLYAKWDSVMAVSDVDNDGIA